MLKNRLESASAAHPLAGKELEEAIAACRMRLERQQMEIKAKGLPVLVLFEGWGAAGKGGIIGRVIRNIDPRFFTVSAMCATPSEEERRRPFLYRYFKEIPEAGKFALLDSGWMDEVMRQRLRGELKSAAYESRIESIRMFERQLTDNGYLVLKLFFHIGEEEQKKRLRKLAGSPDTAWRVSDNDRWQNRHYEACLDAFDQYLSATNAPNAPWYIVDGTDKKQAELEVLRLLTGGIDTALQNSVRAAPLLQNTFPLVPMPRLAEVALDQTVEDGAYREELKALQKRLRALHNRLYRAKVPVVIVYEGWDAAGKGGNIRRVADALDPRGYDVRPIASPEPHEKSRHYLWRFWTRLPKDGHIAIFDRSWYGRVMVERVEGFCSPNDWQRAYNEINEFEHELAVWGAVVIKFWVHIDPETQLARFTARQETPEKQWKITDEDWRNREKWPAYEQAVDEMLQKTSTAAAPWTIIQSNDKKLARLQSLRTIVERLEAVL